jgi:hypothetical protein
MLGLTQELDAGLGLEEFALSHQLAMAQQEQGGNE